MTVLLENINQLYNKSLETNAKTSNIVIVIVSFIAS